MTTQRLTYRDHVIVCGLGKVGYRVVETFLRIGQDVVAIESDDRHSFNDLVRGQGVPLLIGDARQVELLENAGIGDCLALVIVTNDDLTNLDIALTAREICPDVHIVMRVFNDTLARKLEDSFGIRTAFSASAIGAPTFAAAALMRGVRHALHVGNRLLSTIELTVSQDGALVAQPLSELEQRFNAAIIELRTAAGSDLRPQHERPLAPGETIVVVGELHALAALRDLNRSPVAAPRRRLSDQRLPGGQPQDEFFKAEQRRSGQTSLGAQLAKVPRRGWRLVQANLRDADLLLRQSLEPLSAFLVFLLLGTLLLHGISNPNTGEIVLAGYPKAPNESLSWIESFYTMLMMATFQPPLDFPAGPWWIQAIFIVWPILSLILLARGAMSFVLLLLDKRNRREAWDAALASTYYDHIVVVGLSKIGLRVVQEFSELNYEVVALDRDPQGEFNQALRNQGIPILVGDTRQEDLLRGAGIERCRALIIVSDDDLTNLDTALTARGIRPDIHIVLSVFNEALARKLEGSFNIRTAFSAPVLAAPTFAAAALMRGVRHALLVGGRLLSTIELTIRKDSTLDGRFLRRLELDQNVSVIELRVGANATSDLRPRPDHRLSRGDTIVVVGELHDLSELRDLNQEDNSDPMGRNRDAVLTRLLNNPPRSQPRSG